MKYRVEYRQDIGLVFSRHVSWLKIAWIISNLHRIYRCLFVLRLSRFFFVLCMCVGCFLFYVPFLIYSPLPLDMFELFPLFSNIIVRLICYLSECVSGPVFVHHTHHSIIFHLYCVCR
jgi:hypothetical protein